MKDSSQSDRIIRLESAPARTSNRSPMSAEETKMHVHGATHSVKLVVKTEEKLEFGDEHAAVAAKARESTFILLLLSQENTMGAYRYV